jgi:hypothetical protein
VVLDSGLSLIRRGIDIQPHDIDSLRAFGSFFDGELDLLPFIEGLEALASNLRIVHENILTLRELDEPISFARAKPPHQTSDSLSHILSSLPMTSS